MLGGALGAELGILLLLGDEVVGLAGSGGGASKGSVSPETSASWHVPILRCRLPTSLTQFPLQHCLSLKHFPPLEKRLHSLLVGVTISKFPLTIDLHSLLKINPEQFPLQQLESNMHACPPSLLSMHSPFGLSPLNRRALDSLEIAMRNTNTNVNDAFFIFLVVCCLSEKWLEQEIMPFCATHLVSVRNMFGPFET
jgi:hypothetical protein